jgi:preprotein translocase subunit SecG
MKNVFYAISAVAGIIMTVMILLQQQGSGLGSAFGGSSSSFRSKRGAEKVVFNLTIVSGIVFVLSLILGLLSKV